MITSLQLHKLQFIKLSHSAKYCTRHDLLMPAICPRGGGPVFEPRLTSWWGALSLHFHGPCLPLGRTDLLGILFESVPCVRTLANVFPSGMVGYESRLPTRPSEAFALQMKT